MGVQAKVGINDFPTQGAFLHRKVSVCFNYDTSNIIQGVIVRDDVEEPGRLIVALEDGRYVMPTECQYSLS